MNLEPASPVGMYAIDFILFMHFLRIRFFYAFMFDDAPSIERFDPINAHCGLTLQVPAC